MEIVKGVILYEKTNAARLLDAKSISYELVEYEVDESDLSATTLAKKKREGIRNRILVSDSLIPKII